MSYDYADSEHDERVIAGLRAKVDELNERAQAFEIALRSIFEWYDTDGSTGGASDVFEDSRKTLAIYSQDRGTE